MVLDLFGGTAHVLPLVYRKSQKSALPSSALDLRFLVNRTSLDYGKQISTFTPDEQSKMRRKESVIYQEPSKTYDFRNYISIRPSGICEYQRNVIPDISIHNIEFAPLPIDNKHHGIISKKANKNIQSTIDWFVLMAKDKNTYNPKYKSSYSFKINFVTLTLPSKQVHPDKFLQKNLFAPFLDWVRKTKHYKGLDSNESEYCNMYFWRSEAQENGNIHWHLCCDVFIHYQLIQSKWNYLLGKLGYIATFEKKWNHLQPNSTDVHSVRKVRSLAKYLSKYCGKNTKGITVQCSLASKFLSSGYPLFLNSTWNYPGAKPRFFREVHSRLWGCSENLSKIKSCKVMTDEFIEEELRFFRNNFPEKCLAFKYSTVYRVDCVDLFSLEMIFIRKVLARYVLEVFPDRRKIPIIAN